MNRDLAFFCVNSCVFLKRFPPSDPVSVSSFLRGMGVFRSLSAPFIKESKFSGDFSQMERMAFSLLKSISKDCPFLKCYS